MTTILEIRKLKKNYGKLTAVNDISFKIRQGICFGLLGPNGAGKTTALEVIEGILPPTSGEILYKDKPGLLKKRWESNFNRPLCLHISRFTRR